MPQDIGVGSTHGSQRGGYISAASWLVRDADGETLVFHKFNQLAALNLLYLQSELLDIERKIDQIHQDTEYSEDMDLKLAVRKWETIVEQSAEESPKFRAEAKGQIELLRRMRTVMREYRE